MEQLKNALVAIFDALFIVGVCLCGIFVHVVGYAFLGVLFLVFIVLSPFLLAYDFCVATSQDVSRPNDQ